MLQVALMSTILLAIALLRIPIRTSLLFSTENNANSFGKNIAKLQGDPSGRFKPPVVIDLKVPSQYRAGRLVIR